MTFGNYEVVIVCGGVSIGHHRELTLFVINSEMELCNQLDTKLTQSSTSICLYLTLFDILRIFMAKYLTGFYSFCLTPY